MDDQTTMTADPNIAAASAASTVPPGHRKVEGTDYDVIFHPGFASACTIKNKNDAAPRELYRQGTAQSDVVDCRPAAGGHPKRHVIKLKGKNGNGRDITITIDDPSHSLHRISLDLYQEGRDPRVDQPFETTDTFTVENEAKTCPPHCTE